MADFAYFACIWVRTVSLSVWINFQAYPGADPKAFAKFCPHLLQFIVLPALHALIGYRIYQRSNWLALFGDDDIAVAVMNAT